MELSLLESTLNKLKNNTRNKYPESSPKNLIKISENELTELSIKFKRKKRKYNKGHFLDVYDDTQSLFKFVNNTYPNNIKTKLGWKICNDKFLTERFLKYAGIRTLNTMVFEENEYDKALEYVNNSDNKVVVKPVNLMQSLGVYVNTDVSNFTESWNKCLKIQKSYKILKPRVMVQKQLNGLELRVIVNEGKISSASLRLPGYVMGDGQSTIEELINAKNKLRKLNPYTGGRLIKIDKELEYNLNYNNKSLNYILEDGEYYILYPRTGVINGVEIHEVTDQIKPSILKQSLEAVEAIPGIHTSGIDIFIDDLDADEGVVVEVNKAPAYQLNYYPEYGTPQRPLKYVLKSLSLEQKLLNDNLDFNELTKDEFQILINRYKFLYNKNLYSENSILEILNEE